VQQIRINPDTTSPQAIRRRRRRRKRIFLEIDIPINIGFRHIARLFVAREMHANRHNGLEAVWAGHVWDVWSVFFAGRIEDQHAEADQGVAEENGDGKEDHDEEDVDFLAEVAVGEGDC
jgi:hypothetical protein